MLFGLRGFFGLGARAALGASFVLAAAACGSGDGAPQPSSPSSTPPDTLGASPDPSAPGAGSTSSGAPTSTPAPGPAPAPQVPAALTCLASHFVGTPIAQGAGWALHLPDGTDLTWDDGLTKTFAVALETPDLQDSLAMPYPRGVIVPNNTLNLDPGRIRSEALFKATFGASSAAVTQALVSVDFVGQTVKFHPRAAAALGKVSTKLKQLIAQTPSLGAFVTGSLGGTFEWRPIANTTRLSAHSYGIAIDIVVAKSNYWEWEKTPSGTFVWKNQIPQAIVDAFEAEGFAWGGRWYHYDTMHFEYRPELFDPACKP
jgi:hypothetical protein